MLTSTPAVAQVRDLAPEIDRPAPTMDNSWIRAPQTNTGKIGQRQTREDAARVMGIEPMARINSRINNRVQARLRNRIDRNYDPSPDARSAFSIAEDQISASSRPRR